MQYREATVADVRAIARVHAESWRRTYRGSYSDAFLDGDVFADRLAVWTERLKAPTANSATVVAVDDDVVIGFVHTILDHDPAWGALLDNLHVAHDYGRRGIGTALMAASASAVLAAAKSTGLHLWVLDANKAAQAFYKSRGGKCNGSELSEAPGGGSVLGLRYVWSDPSTLL